MNLTVNDVHEMLQDIVDAGGGDREVRVAIQQSYPLACYLDSIKDGNEALSAAMRNAQFRINQIPGLDKLSVEDLDEASEEIIDEVADRYDVDSEDLDKALTADELPEEPVWIVAGGQPHDKPYASKKLWEEGY